MRKICVICGFVIFSLTGLAQEQKLVVLKAAFLYNFTQYLEWEGATKDTITIGVFGHEILVKQLNKIAMQSGNKKIKLVIKKCREILDVANCDMVFYSNSGDRKRITALYELAQELQIVLVADFSSSVPKGIAINFVVRDNKLKFMINQKNLKACRIKASSQLLRLAL